MAAALSSFITITGVPLPTDVRYTEGFYYAFASFSLALLVTSARTHDVLNRRRLWGGLHLKDRLGMTDRQKQLVLLVVLMTFFLIASAGFFAAVEGWNYDDAVYFCVVAFLTIGFGDFSPATFFGRVGVLVLGFVGVTMFGVLIWAIREVILELLTVSLAGTFAELFAFHSDDFHGTFAEEVKSHLDPNDAIPPTATASDCQTCDTDPVGAGPANPLHAHFLVPSIRPTDNSIRGRSRSRSPSRAFEISPRTTQYGTVALVPEVEVKVHHHHHHGHHHHGAHHERVHHEAQHRAHIQLDAPKAQSLDLRKAVTFRLGELVGLRPGTEQSENNEVEWGDEESERGRPRRIVVRRRSDEREDGRQTRRRKSSSGSEPRPRGSVNSKNGDNASSLGKQSSIPESVIISGRAQKDQAPAIALEITGVDGEVVVDGAPPASVSPVLPPLLSASPMDLTQEELDRHFGGAQNATDVAEKRTAEEQTLFEKTPPSTLREAPAKKRRSGLSIPSMPSTRRLSAIITKEIQKEIRSASQDPSNAEPPVTITLSRGDHLPALSITTSAPITEQHVETLTKAHLDDQIFWSFVLFCTHVVIFGTLFAYMEGWGEGSGWGWLDGMYFCFVAMSTIGFGDYVLHNLNTRTLFVGYMLLAIPNLAYLGSVISERLLDEWSVHTKNIEEEDEVRKRRRRIRSKSPSRRSGSVRSGGSKSSLKRRGVLSKRRPNEAGLQASTPLVIHEPHFGAQPGHGILKRSDSEGHADAVGAISQPGVSTGGSRGQERERSKKSSSVVALLEPEEDESDVSQSSYTSESYSSASYTTESYTSSSSHPGSKPHSLSSTPQKNTGIGDSESGSDDDVSGNRTTRRRESHVSTADSARSEQVAGDMEL
ncbi:voltage-gated potassium channel [Gonapodya prolifera JEL478]|uniref:Voltage-gated potassium channel n=1 Tax=Gonapodya prolifera (strain JEL478) TaxID=1344416 RepID=A0A139AUQ5_GONPJ|nr:voltage-gated potassium channel [Gonapodya prolifera JEL478]|eukprot:KXS20447.1 voltage-gated potassium channel [Gonapodya prolifera JEL478]